MPWDSSDAEDAFDDLLARVASATEEWVAQCARELRDAESEDEPRLSGALAGSVEAQDSQRSGVYLAKVGPTSLPYGRRQEIGFHGTDTLGRVYRYSGMAALRRAEKDVLAKFGGGIVDVWGRAMEG